MKGGKLSGYIKKKKKKKVKKVSNITIFSHCRAFCPFILYIHQKAWIKLYILSFNMKVFEDIFLYKLFRVKSVAFVLKQELYIAELIAIWRLFCGCSDWYTCICYEVTNAGQ